MDICLKMKMKIEVGFSSLVLVFQSHLLLLSLLLFQTPELPVVSRSESLVPAHVPPLPSKSPMTVHVPPLASILQNSILSAHVSEVVRTNASEPTLVYQRRYSKQDMFISRRKYLLDHLQGTDELGCKPPSVPIEQNHNEHRRQKCEG